MKKILISLVSDQTIPNVRFIKEYKEDVSDFLFVSTQKMEKKGCRDWIVKTAAISNTSVIIVDEYNPQTIISALDEINLEQYDKIIVNLTGGTKIMSLTIYEYFREEGADIFYVTGHNDDYIKLFPGKNKNIKQFKTTLSLHEYLLAYGFEITQTEPCGIEYKMMKNWYNKYINGEFSNHVDALNILRLKRGKTFDCSNSEPVLSFLKSIDFIPANGKLSKNEVKALTGEWLEEYVGASLMDELKLTSENILIGSLITKNGISNEMDVMFYYNSQFYVIECKTSIINTVSYWKQQILKDGTIKYDEYTKNESILGETVYKSDYLKNRFGLFAKSYIFTLSKKEEVSENQIKRAILSGIKLIDQDMLLSAKSINELL